MITKQVLTYTQLYTFVGQLHISELESKRYLYFIYIKRSSLFPYNI